MYSCVESSLCVAFPCVFGLLPNRLKTTYHHMFQELKSLATQMQLPFTPKLVMSDFEPGLINVVKAEVSLSSKSECNLNLS